MGINPFDHGSEVHTDVMKTQALKQALDKHGFDAAFGGARRDEEKSRAKERVFSFRSAQHRWDPKNQRPELWRLYNARKRRGESIRVFPLSNWTELDVWQYIEQEQIPIVPLYFAAERPVVERDGTLIMVDDDRMRARARRGAGDAHGALPHARLLPADRRGRERRRHAAEDHRGDAADAHVRARRAASSTTTRPPRWSRRSRRVLLRHRGLVEHEPAALHHLRQRRRRQEHADRPPAVRVPAASSRTSSPRSRPTPSAPARRAASSTSRCCSTAWPPSASRASRSTSPTATSRRRRASSSSPTRRATSSTRATWSRAPRPPTPP